MRDRLVESHISKSAKRGSPGREWHETGEIREKEWRDYLDRDGMDPLLRAIRRKYLQREVRELERVGLEAGVGPGQVQGVAAGCVV